MSFIIKKEVSGKEYYYLRKSVREKGKVKAVTIAYLGKTKKEAEKKRKEVEKSEKDNNVEKNKKQNGEREVMSSIDEKNNSDVVEGEKAFVSFLNEGGLIWGPEPEIYGGLAGFYTYGPLGKLLKNKVEGNVRNTFNQNGFREIEGPTVLPDIVWKASGHLDTFTDPIIKTKDGKESFRADKLIEDAGIELKKHDSTYLLSLLKENNIKSPGGKELDNKIENYSLMMKTEVAGKPASLRPETATVTYLPFLRTFNYFRKKLPFGVFQIGKAYRNEISPRQSVLRGREFTQAEAQIFIDPLDKNNWDKFNEICNEELPVWSEVDQKSGKTLSLKTLADMFENNLVKSRAYGWCLWLAYKQFINFGIPRDKIRLRQHLSDEKAFYADDAWDVEINLNNPGWTEVCGVHDRTDYDLKKHSDVSGVELKAIRENGEKFYPHILEIAFGTDRPVYSLIDLFYEKKTEGDGKTIFKIPYKMAPIDVSVFPLMKKTELLNLALRVKKILEKDFLVDYDVSGSIGKRYLRSMGAGTPVAITIDYDSINGDDVTMRDRDSGEQQRVKISELREKLREALDN